MNNRFTDEQIRVYASSFRENDAVWCNGKWNEVVKSGMKYPDMNDDRLTAFVENNYSIINTGSIDYTGSINGFREKIVSNPYRVTALSDYDLQGGEKIVWLGSSDGFRTFGRMYKTNSDAKYQDDMGDLLPVVSPYWGIIPRYEHVKDSKQINTDITLTLKDIEKLNQFNLVFHDSKHLVELLDSLGNHEQANELMQNLLSVKEVVDNVDRQRNQIAKELMRKECVIYD